MVGRAVGVDMYPSEAVAMGVGVGVAADDGRHDDYRALGIDNWLGR